METRSSLHEELPDLARACLGLQPVVVDAGGLGFLSHVTAPAIITPHEGELERLVPRGASSRREWACRAANERGVLVVLKGHHTLIAAPEEENGETFVLGVTAPTTWLATAGTGDVLAGIIAALVATHSVNRIPHFQELAQIAATGVYVHGQAAQLAAQQGPFPALELNDYLSKSVAALLNVES
jgi:NAD(P)H-hydrate repair Nnr-like enzyme with NAD(P)H-hydrate dehydratase domain